jgi:hypothetical protein
MKLGNDLIALCNELRHHDITPDGILKHFVDKEFILVITNGGKYFGTLNKVGRDFYFTSSNDMFRLHECKEAWEIVA